MKAIKCILLLLILNSRLQAQSESDSITAYKIINNSITAMGGLEYLKSVKTLYTDVKTEMEGHQVHWIIKEMLPNKGSFEIVYKERIVYRNWFDGKKGFEIVNGEKKKADNDFKDKPFKNIFKKRKNTLY